MELGTSLFFGVRSDGLDQRGDGDDFVVFGDLLGSNARSHASLCTDFIGVLADHNAVSGSDHYFIAGIHHAQCSQLGSGLLELGADQADAAATLLAEFLHLDPLAVAIVGDYKDVRLRIWFQNVKADNPVAFAQGDGAHASGRSSHRAQLFLAVANAHAVAGADDNVGLAVGWAHPTELVAIAQGDGND